MTFASNSKLAMRVLRTIPAGVLLVQLEIRECNLATTLLGS